MSFTGVFSFSSLLTLSALDTVLCHVFHIHSFFRSDLIQSLDLSCHVLTTPRCISPAQMSDYPELSHVLMFMYLIAICGLTDIINQQVQNKILTVPQRPALPPIFPI